MPPADYQDGHHEAYRRLIWAQANRPSPEKLEEINREAREEQFRAKVARLRRSVV